MKAGTLLGCLAVAFAGSLAAQTPTIDAGGVVNAASYAYAGTPSGGVAQGSLFAIFGKNLGTVAQATTFPIPTTLGGASVRVTSGSASGQALMFYVSAGQITALLPSNIPAGTASLTVTTSAGTSASQSFQVVASSFGTFTRNSAGTGPAIVTNKDFAPFTISNAANPDETAVIWGTGLGPVSGNEAGGPLPGDLTSIPVEVFFGNTKATVTYRGRSGNVGVDQINFTVPNILGCKVPVVVKINNVVSNQTALPIAAKGSRTCSDPGGPSTAELAKYARDGVSIGVVSLNRVATTLSLPGIPTIPGIPGIPGGDQTFNADVGAATFTRFTPAQFEATADPFQLPVLNACTVAYSKGTAPGLDPVAPKSLDAGTAITINGPGGVKTLTKSAIVGPGFFNYGNLLNVITDANGYLNAGTYTATGPGGADVGGFTASISVSTPLTWANKAAITDVSRAAGQAVTWTGGDPASTVLITGTSTGGADAPVATFFCYAPASAGTFTIPSQILLAMPVSTVVSGVATGSLAVGQYGVPKTFTATGLDIGIMINTNLSLKNLNYK